MIKNYLKIAWRNIWKTKGFSAINIFGLAVGMTACFLIAVYVNFELSYDNYHSKAGRIYRLGCDINTPSDKLHLAITSGPMGTYLSKDFPEVETFARIAPNSFLVRKDDIKFQEGRVFLADSTLFDIFDFPLVAGNPKTALVEPLSIVLSESTAKKYFGNENPMGKSLLITDQAFPVKITGIMKDMPENSQFKADMLASMSTMAQTFKDTLDNQWGNFGVTTYLLLKPNTNPASLESKFPGFLKKRVGEMMDQQKMHFTLALEPLRDVYLRSDRTEGFETGNINNVYIFSIVAIFVLLVACINFINLSTARALERAKEVGLRKVVGAYRSQIMRQFLSESILICLFSFVIAILLCWLIIPYFNDVVGKQISEGLFHEPVYIGILFLLAIFIGLLAGIYPAIVLSSFNPVTVLKGKFSSNAKGQFLRKSLVIVQFVVSIALIAGTLIVTSQLGFMRDQDLGFSKDQMLVLRTYGDAKSKLLKEALTSLPGVLSSSLSSSVPGGGNPVAYSEIENNKGDMQVCSLPLYYVDDDYIPQYKMHIVAGRAFSKDFGTDTAKALILNESAVRLLGYTSPKEAIGRRFSQWGREGQIIGVVKDFHFKSLQSKIEPLSMQYVSDGGGLISVKIDGKQVTTTLKAVEKKWQEMIPDRPFEYYFADEFFNRQYQSENRFGSIFLNFAVLAIFISCLGLFGLVSYNTTQRFREIGVRKVLGSSITGIVRLLSVDFMKLVLFAILIATPITWFFMHRWLDNFAYHISLSWWFFAVAGIIAVVIALGVISSLTVRAARANPVDSLRDE